MKENTSIRLKKIMAERNLRQVDILKICEPYCEKYNVLLSKNYLSQYISGKVVPRQKVIEILGIALNVNDAWLAGFDVSIERELNKLANDLYDDEMLKTFHRLNNEGKKEAINRIAELSFIPKYVK